MRFGARLFLVAAGTYLGVAAVLVPAAGVSVYRREPLFASPMELINIVQEDGGMASVSAFAAALAAGLLLLPWVLVSRAILTWRTPPIERVGGEKWGDRADLKRAKLVGKRGVIVGRDGPKPADLLAYDGPEHHLVVGATRAGKGVGHVVPTLLTWAGSACIYDIKGELWTLTAGFRGRFGHAVRFAPTRPGSARFNPLFEIRSDRAVSDAQNLATILVDPGGKKDQLDIWDQQSVQWLVAVILHVLYTCPDDQKNMGTVRRMTLDFEATLEMMGRNCHIIDEHGDPAPHPEIANVARALEQQAERFRTSVRGTVEGYLILWADPMVVEATSTSDFCASDLMTSDAPVSLYIEAPPSDAARLRPLIRALLFQLTRANMENLETDGRGREKKHKLLLLLDEFPTLGKLSFMSDNLRQMAGYGIKAHLIVQSFSDIAEAYGPHNTIIDNCYVVVAFAAADTASAKRISDMLGTVVEHRRSFNQKRLAPFAWGSRSESKSEQVRPLLTPAEVRELPPTQQLILLNGFDPFLTRKVTYYDDPTFMPRLLPAPDAEARPDTPNPGLADQEWSGVRAFDVLPPDGEEPDDPADSASLFEQADQADLAEEAEPHEAFAEAGAETEPTSDSESTAENRDADRDDPSSAIFGF